MVTPETSFTILVFILSLMLIVFLVVGIIVLVKLAQILKQVSRIITKAEMVADKAEVVGEFFRKTAAPLAIGKLIANIMDAVLKKGKGQKDGKD